MKRKIRKLKRIQQIETDEFRKTEILKSSKIKALKSEKTKTRSDNHKEPKTIERN